MNRQDWEQDAGLTPESAKGAGEVAGQATGPGVDAGEVSGETVEETLEQVVERVLSAKLGTLRQDLSTDIERRVQSFSDKTADRLSKEQRARLQLLDEVMDGLKDTLGPDFDQVKRQRQLDILLKPGESQPAQQPAQTPTATASASGGDAGAGFAEAYLSTKLGDPSQYSAEEQATIRRELSSAQDWGAWMQVVERYAATRAGRQTGTQAQPGGSRVARAQPMQTGKPTVGPMTPEQLQKAFNAAAVAGNSEEMQRLGVLIDKLVG